MRCNAMTKVIRQSKCDVETMARSAAKRNWLLTCAVRNRINDSWAGGQTASAKCQLGYWYSETQFQICNAYIPICICIFAMDVQKNQKNIRIENGRSE